MAAKIVRHDQIADRKGGYRIRQAAVSVVPPAVNPTGRLFMKLLTSATVASAPQAATVTATIKPFFDDQ